MTIKSNIEAKRAEKQRQINEEAKLLKLKKQYNQQLLAMRSKLIIINRNANALNHSILLRRKER